MFVHVKQSGESLSSLADAGMPWHAEAIAASADNIARVYTDRAELGVDGLLLVSGAGNLVRGAELRRHGLADGKADFLGRLATIQNTVVLAEALKERDVQIAQFIADTMLLKDIAISSEDYRPYDPKLVAEAYDKDKVVLVAGGTGEDNKTTDNAVLEYARRHRLNFPYDDVVVMKGTKYDGVFDADPAKEAEAQRFVSISAGAIQADYERFAVVDKASLETIQKSGLSLRVYADGLHCLEDVLRRPDDVGTLIIPGYAEPVYAEEARL